MQHLSVGVDSHIASGNNAHGRFSTGIDLSSLLLMYCISVLGCVQHGFVMCIGYELANSQPVHIMQPMLYTIVGV